MDAILMMALITLTGFACWTDLRRRLIPNALTVTYACGGFLYQGIAHGWSGLAQALLGGAAGMTPLLIMYVLRGIGGGDVKWFFAFGAWAGAQTALQLVVHSILAAGVIALGLLLFRRLCRQDAGQGERQDEIQDATRGEIQVGSQAEIHDEIRDEIRAKHQAASHEELRDKIDNESPAAAIAADAIFAATANKGSSAARATFPFMAAVAPAFVYVLYGQW